LVLLSEATVQEVVLEMAEGEWAAKGVRFVHGEKEHVVTTEGEIIICAGSVQSPQLLELSGIGNPDILKAAGIESKVDNPNVGENLQDHMSTY
jgi:choline dehydrogenase-like flavoprotein